MRLLLLSPEGHDLHRVECLACEWVPLDDCKRCGGTRLAKPPNCDCDLCLREDHPRALAGVDPVMP